MIYWFWKYKPLMRRLPVLMALLAGFMFTVRPGQQGHVHAKQTAKSFTFLAKGQDHKPLQAADAQSSSEQDIPVFEPGFQALAQVAPLQIFLYQPAILPVLCPLVEVVDQAATRSLDLVNNYYRILFRHIISPNAP